MKTKAYAVQAATTPFAPYTSEHRERMLENDLKYCSAIDIATLKAA